MGDFGLSRVVGDGPSEDTASSGSLGGCGTVRWMAPELVHDEPSVPPAAGPTLSSDVWAFGCMFYEARKYFHSIFELLTED